MADISQFCILIKLSLRFVPKGPINNIPSLVQIMAWRHLGDKSLSELMMVSLPTHICVTWPQWVKFSQVTVTRNNVWSCYNHDDVIKWKHFTRYWPFVRGIHRSAVNYPHKGQWRGAWMFSLICAWKHVWVNKRKAGDLRRHRAHYDDNVMILEDKMAANFLTTSNAFPWMKIY